MGKSIRRRHAAAMVRAAVTAILPLTLLSTARADSPAPPGGDSVLLDATTQQEVAPTGSGFDNDLTGDWWGLRQRLQNAGITVGATLTLEGFSNFQGGIDTAHLIGATTFDLNLALDTDKLLHWHGGEFYVDLEDHAFGNPSTALVGDLQVFDKQNTSPYLQIFEMWYQQQLFDDKIRIKIGKVDANTEFYVVDNGLPFLNSSTQVSPTIFMFPTTPDPMPSVNVFFTPNESYYASFAAYYANRSDQFGDLVDDPAKAQSSDFGTFLIGETGLKWHALPIFALAGNLKVGASEHTGTFTRFDGAQQQGAYGSYAILDQTLWQPKGEPDNGRGVRAFLEYGGTQNDINAIDQHIGGGITWTGPIDARPGDILGFSPQYAHISSQAGLTRPYELALETFYQWQLTAWALFQPDLQYIVHPGGTYANALVATLRLQISF
ncbi:MAG: carbohydrate porin [Tepidisphaeraceae bacterium]